jgi:hypothetical protein
MNLQTCADAGLQGSRKTAATMSSEFTGDDANTKYFLSKRTSSYYFHHLTTTW